MEPRTWFAVITAAAVVCACGGSSPSAPSQPVCTPVTPALLRLGRGELFRVKFRVPTGLTRDVVLLTYLGLPDSGFSSSSVVHRLFDGPTLLGTYDRNDQATIAFWKSPESSFGTPGDTAYFLSSPAVSVNFDAIVSGTIDGRVELAVTSGMVTITSAEQAAIMLIAPGSGTALDTRADITAREWCRSG